MSLESEPDFSTELPQGITMGSRDRLQLGRGSSSVVESHCDAFVESTLDSVTSSIRVTVTPLMFSLFSFLSDFAGSNSASGSSGDFAGLLSPCPFNKWLDLMEAKWSTDELVFFFSLSGVASVSWQIVTELIFLHSLFFKFPGRDKISVSIGDHFNPG